MKKSFILVAISICLILWVSNSFALTSDTQIESPFISKTVQSVNMSDYISDSSFNSTANAYYDYYFNLKPNLNKLSNIYVEYTKTGKIPSSLEYLRGYFDYVQWLTPKTVKTPGQKIQYFKNNFSQMDIVKKKWDLSIINSNNINKYLSVVTPTKKDPEIVRKVTKTLLRSMNNKDYITSSIDKSTLLVSKPDILDEFNYKIYSSNLPFYFQQPSFEGVPLINSSKTKTAYGTQVLTNCILLRSINYTRESDKTTITKCIPWKTLSEVIKSKVDWSKIR